VTTRFLYDGDNDLAEYDASGIAQATYVTPFLDQNLSMTIPAGLPHEGTYFYVQDGLGSVRNLLDAAQAAVNRYDYEAFGQLFATCSSGAVANEYLYSARRSDAQLGQLHFRNRQYIASEGRFTARDPRFSSRLTTAKGTASLQARRRGYTMGQGGYSAFTPVRRIAGTGREERDDMELMSQAMLLSAPYAYPGQRPTCYRDPMGEGPVLVGILLTGVVTGVTAIIVYFAIEASEQATDIGYSAHIN